MLSIEPIITKESVASPGVVFQVRSLSKRERAAREFGLIDARALISECIDEIMPLMPPAKGNQDTRTPAEVRRCGALDMKIAAIMERDIKPAVIRSALVSIEGLEISGKAATPDLLLSGGHKLDELLEEIYDACNEASGLTEEQIKNSESPTISSEPVAGEMSSSNDAGLPAGA